MTFHLMSKIKSLIFVMFLLVPFLSWVDLGSEFSFIFPSLSWCGLEPTTRSCHSVGNRACQLFATEVPILYATLAHILSAFYLCGPPPRGTCFYTWLPGVFPSHASSSASEALGLLITGSHSRIMASEHGCRSGDMPRTTVVSSPADYFCGVVYFCFSPFCYLNPFTPVDVLPFNSTRYYFKLFAFKLIKLILSVVSAEWLFHPWVNAIA